MTDVLVCGISGWFTPHGSCYHEDRRRLDQIAPEEWAALLAHAEAIDFFTRLEPAPAASDARIFHLAITAGDRSRELAINDPFATPELARLITLTRRALRDRQVMMVTTMSDEDLAAFRTALAAQDAPSVSIG